MTEFNKIRREAVEYVKERGCADVAFYVYCTKNELSHIRKEQKKWYANVMLDKELGILSDKQVNLYSKVNQIINLTIIHAEVY